MAGILNEVQAWVVENQSRINGNDYDSLVTILRNLQDIDIRAHRPKPIVNLVHRKLSECLEIFVWPKSREILGNPGQNPGPTKNSWGP